MSELDLTFPSKARGPYPDYDIFSVRQILGRSHPPQSFLDASERKYFGSTVWIDWIKNGPLTTGLPASASRYKGSWYHQGLEGTCAPWAFANSLEAIGVRPNSLCLTAMLNLALKGKALMDKLVEILRRYPEQGVEIRQKKFDIFVKGRMVPRSQILDESFGLAENEKAELIQRMRKCPIEPDRETMRGIGVWIKEVIDSRSAILARVDTRKYANEAKGRNHLICIGGYAINERGHMRTQVIDSARGVLWMPLEHLATSLIDYEAYEARQTFLRPSSKY